MYFLYFINPCFEGCAISQALSRRFPTAAARVRTQVMSCGICGRQSGTGAGSLHVLRFPLPILIPQTAPHSSSSSGAGTIGQFSGLSLTPPSSNKRKKKTPCVLEKCLTVTCGDF
jgi:hypothetical protein